MWAGVPARVPCGAPLPSQRYRQCPPMPFDALAAAAIADELRTTLVGGRVQHIVQPSELSVGLSVYARGETYWLLLSADPSFARVHLVEGKLAKGFPTPSSFVMLLRKYLEG